MSYILWFFLFLSVPIIVHLFNFRRARKFFFTNVRFVRQVSTETRSKTRLKHLLILSARFFTMLFIILAFVAEILNLNSGNFTAQDASGVIYLDNSPSSLGSDILDDFAFVERLIVESKLHSGYLLTNDFSTFSNHSRSSSELLDELSNISLSYVSRSLEEVLNRTDDGTNIYLISDFHEANLEDLSRIKEDSLRNYHIFFKESLGVRNVFVDSVWIERDLNDYELNILTCRIGHTSELSEGSIVVKLMDERGDQISSVVLKVENSLEVSFSLPSNHQSSFFKLVLSGDDIQYDNEFYFVWRERDPPKILILSSNYNKYLTNIFGNRELFDQVLMTLEDFDYKTLSETDLVVLNDFSQIPNGIVRQNSALTSFLVIPSDSIDLKNYQLETGLLIGQNASNFQEIGMSDGNTLLNGVFEKFSKSSDFPSASSIYEVNGAHDKILLLRDGNSYLARSLKSTLYFLTSPLTDDYTELPNHSIFLPLMYRIAEESKKSNDHLFVYPNDLIEIEKISVDEPPRIVSETFEMIPELIVGERNGLVRVPVNLSPGVYQLLNGADTILSFGLNLTKSESKFEGPQYDEFKEFFSDSPHVSLISTSDNYDNVILPSVDTNSLWKYALILALIFIMVETMFHRFLK